MLPRQREEDEGVSSYPDHDGLNSGEDTPMAAVAGMDNASLPKLKRLSSEVDARKRTTVAIARRGRALCCQWRRRSYGAALCLLRATKEKTENRMRAWEGAGE